LSCLVLESGLNSSVPNVCKVSYTFSTRLHRSKAVPRTDPEITKACPSYRDILSDPKDYRRIADPNIRINVLATIDHNPHQCAKECDIRFLVTDHNPPRMYFIGNGTREPVRSSR